MVGFLKQEMDLRNFGGLLVQLLQVQIRLDGNSGVTQLHSEAGLKLASLLAKKVLKKGLFNFNSYNKKSTYFVQSCRVRENDKCKSSRPSCRRVHFQGQTLDSPKL